MNKETLTIEIVKRKIDRNEYKVKRNPKTGLKSAVWDVLYCIYDEDNDLIDEFIHCKQCKKVLIKPAGSSTKNLLTHLNKCSQKINPIKQGTIGNLLLIIEQTMAVTKSKPEHKSLITSSLSQMSILDFRPFSTCIGVGFRSYSQNLINVAAKVGIY